MQTSDIFLLVHKSFKDEHTCGSPVVGVSDIAELLVEDRDPIEKLVSDLDNIEDLMVELRNPVGKLLRLLEIFKCSIVDDFDVFEDFCDIDEPHVFLHTFAISGSEQSSFIFGQIVGSAKVDKTEDSIIDDFNFVGNLDTMNEPHVFLHKLAISGSEQSSFMFGQTVGSVEIF